MFILLRSLFFFQFFVLLQFFPLISSLGRDDHRELDRASPSCRSCGDVMKPQIKVNEETRNGGKIVDARFKTSIEPNKKIQLWFLMFLNISIKPAPPRTPHLASSRTARIFPFLCSSQVRFLQPTGIRGRGKKGRNPPRP
jgi:hypothetical protein